eukprot:Ihof_evm3s287 gene=Ihof_evmTU3s287
MGRKDRRGFTGRRQMLQIDKAGSGNKRETPPAKILWDYDDSDEDKPTVSEATTSTPTPEASSIPVNTSTLSPSFIPISSTTTSQPEWMACLDSNTGHYYYWNSTTNEVVWELPEGIKEIIYNDKVIDVSITGTSWVQALYNDTVSMITETTTNEIEGDTPDLTNGMYAEELGNTNDQQEKNRLPIKNSNSGNKARDSEDAVNDVGQGQTHTPTAIGSKSPVVFHGFLPIVAAPSSSEDEGEIVNRKEDKQIDLEGTDQLNIICHKSYSSLAAESSILPATTNQTHEDAIGRIKGPTISAASVTYADRRLGDVSSDRPIRDISSPIITILGDTVQSVHSQVQPTNSQLGSPMGPQSSLPPSSSPVAYDSIATTRTLHMVSQSDGLLSKATPTNSPMRARRSPFSLSPSPRLSHNTNLSPHISTTQPDQTGVNDDDIDLARGSKRKMVVKQSGEDNSNDKELITKEDVKYAKNTVDGPGRTSSGSTYRKIQELLKELETIASIEDKKEVERREEKNRRDIAENQLEQKRENDRIDREKSDNIKEIEGIARMLQSKLRFLGYEITDPSSFAIMAVEITTRLEDWKAGVLPREYLLKKLQDAADRVIRFESRCMPPDWRCEWNDAKACYIYYNEVTGDHSDVYPSYEATVPDTQTNHSVVPPQPQKEDVQRSEIEGHPEDMDIEDDISSPEPGEIYEAQRMTSTQSDLPPPPPSQPPPPSPPPPPPPPPSVVISALPTVFIQGSTQPTTSSSLVGTGTLPDSKSDADGTPLQSESETERTEPVDPYINPSRLAMLLKQSPSRAESPAFAKKKIKKKTKVGAVVGDKKVSSLLDRWAAVGKQLAGEEEESEHEEARVTPEEWARLQMK